MTTKQDYHDLLDRMAALRSTLVDRLGPNLIERPELGEAIDAYADQLMATVVEAELAKKGPVDNGLAELVGIGPGAADDLARTFVPIRVGEYDDTVTSERIIALGDLYYLYHHEKVGVFRAILKLQQLFRAGTVRLSSGEGAFGLYQYDRRQVLRYTQHERMQAYRRAFGYTQTTPPAGAQPNRDFHTLYVHFMTQVAQFFRDKRISELFRPRTADPSFGSIAVVRRAGLDLRNNLKQASYGHINVLRVEVLQLLDEAFRILGTPDVIKLFGADHAWDVIEEVMARYLNRPQIYASQHSRMATAGRNVLHWLAQPAILNATRAEFEALLADVAEEAEEWLTSAESLGITGARQPMSIRPARNGRAPALKARENSWELDPGL